MFTLCWKIKFNIRNTFFQKVFKIEILYSETCILSEAQSHNNEEG